MRKEIIVIIIAMLVFMLPIMVVAAPGGNKPPKTVDADTLDGLDSSDFALSNHDHNQFFEIRTSYYSVNPVSCTEANDIDNLVWAADWTISENGISNRDTTLKTFNCPINLPDGSLIKSATFFYSNPANPTANVLVRLIKKGMMGSTVYMTDRLVLGHEYPYGNVFLEDFIEPLIENYGYTYTLKVEIGNDPQMIFKGVTIEYEYTLY